MGEWYHRRVAILDGTPVDIGFVGFDVNDATVEIWQRRSDGTLLAVKQGEVAYESIAELVKKDAERYGAFGEGVCTDVRKFAASAGRDFAIEVLGKYGKYAPCDCGV